LTTEQEVARFLAYALQSLGGSITVTREALDNMLPVRLVWDATSDPRTVTVAVISNEVIELVVEKSTEVAVDKDMSKIKSPEHEKAMPAEAEPVIQQETRDHPDVDDDEDEVDNED
jgi:hypothetical protein